MRICCSEIDTKSAFISPRFVFRHFGDNVPVILVLISNFDLFKRVGYSVVGCSCTSVSFTPYGDRLWFYRVELVIKLKGVIICNIICQVSIIKTYCVPLGIRAGLASTKGEWQD